MEPLIKYYRKKFISSLSLLAGSDCAGQRYLLAVSGGPDSMALATLAVSALPHRQLGIAHCDFGLRPESSREAQFVKDYFSNLDLPVFSRVFDTGTYAADHRLSIQEAARELRYAYFAELCRDQSFDFVLTGHHLQDHSETFMLHLARGSGLTGLGAIPARNGPILRPLLGWKKKELHQWLELTDVPFVQDQSNLKSTYDRNYLRLEVLPAYRKRFSGLDEAILKSTRILQETDKYLAGRIKKELELSLSELPFGQILHLERLNDQELMPFTIRRLLQQFDFAHEAIDDLLRSISNDEHGKKIITATGKQAIYSRGEICIFNSPLINWDTEFILRPGEYAFHQGKLLVSENEAMPLRVDPFTIFLPAELMNIKLQWRSRAPGDKIALRSGHQKIQDLYTNEKLNYFQKESQPLLANDDHILWVPGLRSAYFEKDILRTLKLTFIPASEFKLLFMH